MTKQTDQVAALPVKLDGDRLQVLLITSRDTGRWIMPKGWPMKGKKDWRAAEIEALEEAGVEGKVSRKPIGAFVYAKVLDDGSSLPVSVTVYALYVEKVNRRWKERRERKRHWFSPKGAAKALKQPELEKLLLDLKKDPRKVKPMREILP